MASVKSNGSTTKCDGCKKDVYAHEKIVLNCEIFHPGCVKCTVCKRNLTISNFAKGGDKWYCKTHYKAAFVSAGGKYPAKGKEPTWKDTIFKKPEAAPPPMRKTSAEIATNLAEKMGLLKKKPDPTWSSALVATVQHAIDNYSPEVLTRLKLMLLEQLERLRQELGKADVKLRKSLQALRKSIAEATTYESLAAVRVKVEALIIQVKDKITGKKKPKNRFFGLFSRARVDPGTQKNKKAVPKPKVSRKRASKTGNGLFGY